MHNGGICLSLQSQKNTVPVVQLVRASDCGSECRRFESDRAPSQLRKKTGLLRSFFLPPPVPLHQGEVVLRAPYPLFSDPSRPPCIRGKSCSVRPIPHGLRFAVLRTALLRLFVDTPHSLFLTPSRPPCIRGKSCSVRPIPCFPTPPVPPASGGSRAPCALSHMACASLFSARRFCAFFSSVCFEYNKFCLPLQCHGI